MCKTSYDGGAGNASPAGGAAEGDLSPETIQRIAQRVVAELRGDLILDDSDPPTPRLLTTAQVADLLQVSERQIQILSNRGRLRPIRISKRSVRYSAENVNAFIRESIHNTGANSQRRKRL